jgi:hypothetical protein
MDRESRTDRPGGRGMSLAEFGNPPKDLSSSVVPGFQYQMRLNGPGRRSTRDLRDAFRPI